MGGEDWEMWLMLWKEKLIYLLDTTTGFVFLQDLIDRAVYRKEQLR
jgi:trans-2-enoyl-CoA reductase